MDNDMIDISSVSEELEKKKKTKAKKMTEKKTNLIKNIKIPTIKETGFKSLGNIIKVISFVVAIVILLVFVLAAYILFAFKPLYLTVSIAIVVFGLLVSLITLFLIYASGHIINQNNEIISRLNEKE